jgi:hypothetical protein
MLAAFARVGRFTKDAPLTPKTEILRSGFPRSAPARQNQACRGTPDNAREPSLAQDDKVLVYFFLGSLMKTGR